MAVNIISDFDVLYTADDAIGGADTFSGFQRYGTACNGGQVSRDTGHFTTTVPSFSLVGRRISTWMTAPASAAPIASGGYRIVIGDGTNTRAYFVGGGDVAAFTQNGWNCFVLDSGALPENFEQLAGGSEPNLSALTVAGIGFDIPTKAVGNSPNVFWDVLQVGTGLTVTGGSAADPGVFDEIVDWDRSLSAATGTIRRLGQGVYSAQFGFTFGSTTEDSHFEDTNSLLFFEGIPSDSIYKIATQGNAGNTNVFKLGSRLGTGESAIGVAGVTIQSSVQWLLDVADPNCTTELFGSTFRGATNGVALSGEMRSCTIDRGAKADVGTTLIRFSTFSTTSSTDAALLWNESINIRNTAFNGNSSAGIEYPSPGTYDHVNLSFAGNTHDVNFSGTGDLLINAVGSSNTSTFTITGSGTVVIQNTVSLTFTGLEANSEVRIYSATDNTELAGVENTEGSFSYTYNFQAGVEVNYVIFNIQFQPVTATNFELPSNDTSLPIQQIFDRVYSNPQ